jgi:prevent-host-death family protein
MKIESLRDVKANLSKIVKKLPSDRSVVITKNGRPCAVLFPVTEDTDIESMVLAQNKEFWQLMDRAHKEGEKNGLPNSRICLTRRPLTKSFARPPHFTRGRDRSGQKLRRWRCGLRAGLLK